MRYSPRALVRRAQMLLTAAKITLTSDDQDVQTLQLQLDEIAVRDDTPAIYMFGFTSRPVPGASAIMLASGGDRKHGVVIATGDTRFRPKLQEGQSAQHDAAGTQITLTNDGNITIKTSGVVTIMGDLHVTGAVIAGFGTGDQVGLQTHKHSSGPAPTPGT